MTSVPVADIGRINADLAEIAALTEPVESAGLRRAFSREHRLAHRFVRRRIREMGLEPFEDAIGNIFIRWEGKNPDAPAVATGSHLDEGPGFPSLTGAIGVIPVLEIFRILKASGFEPARPLELIVLGTSRPERFNFPFLGARLLANTVSEPQAHALVDANGKFMDEWRADVEFVISDLTTIPLVRGSYSAFIEILAPIESSPGSPVGLVSRFTPASSAALPCSADILQTLESAARTAGIPTRTVEFPAETDAYHLLPIIPSAAIVPASISPTDIQPAVQLLTQTLVDLCQ